MYIGRACGVIPLNALLPGRRAKIVSVVAGRGLQRRLFEMGLHIGAEIKMLHLQGGSVVVLKGETRIILGRGVSFKILVQPLNK